MRIDRCHLLAMLAQSHRVFQLELAVCALASHEVAVEALLRALALFAGPVSSHFNSRFFRSSGRTAP